MDIKELIKEIKERKERSGKIQSETPFESSDYSFYLGKWAAFTEILDFIRDSISNNNEANK